MLNFFGNCLHLLYCCRDISLLTKTDQGLGVLNNGKPGENLPVLFCAWAFKTWAYFILGLIILQVLHQFLLRKCGIPYLISVRTKWIRAKIFKKMQFFRAPRYFYIADRGKVKLYHTRSLFSGLEFWQYLTSCEELPVSIPWLTKTFWDLINAVQF